MIKIEKMDVDGFVAAIRGMRNPMNSWDKSDSDFCHDTGYAIGPKDHELAMKLVRGGSVHAKFRRMIHVSIDITAPLYWWKEFDTYKIGTVSNSCSTMHKIHANGFTLDDFSHEHLINGGDESESNKFTAIDIDGGTCLYSPVGLLQMTCVVLNHYRRVYLDTKDKRYWWQMIQLLPSSYNQKRTITFNYEVLANIYKWREDHKLDEWRELCKWIESLPYSEFITGEKKE